MSLQQIYMLIHDRFPGMHKDTIKDTLTAVAVRVGDKQADKRWKLNDGI